MIIVKFKNTFICLVLFGLKNFVPSIAHKYVIKEMINRKCWARSTEQTKLPKPSHSEMSGDIL